MGILSINSCFWEEVVAIRGEAGIVIRISRFKDFFPPVLKSDHIFRMKVQVVSPFPPGCRLVMDEACIGGPEVCISCFQNPKAKVRVAETHREILIECPRFFEYFTSYHHTGGGNCRTLPYAEQFVQVASAGTPVFVFRKKLVAVPGTTVNAENDACMLNEAIGIEEFSANCADFRSLRMFQKGL